MSIQIEETFQIAVPVEDVWRFLLDPHHVVTCMPGAELEKVIDDQTFDGAVKIKLGAITTRYRGRVKIIDADDQAYCMRMLAEGRETGGGTAKATLTSELHALAKDHTEVTISAQVDLTGRVMQIGSRMIEGVSNQLIGQFVARTRQALEVPASVTGGEVTPAVEESIPLLRVILSVVWAPVARFFRQIFGRAAN